MSLWFQKWRVLSCFLTQKHDAHVKLQLTKPENKDYKIIIVGDSHARGCAVRMNEYFSENVEVRGYVKPGVSADILIKIASNDTQSNQIGFNHSVGSIE